MSSQLTKRHVRDHFERAAYSYKDASGVQKECTMYLLDRAAPFLPGNNPKTILDAGCGTGHGTFALRNRYPKASVYALDFSHAMTALSAQAPAIPVCADVEALPLAPNTLDFVFSNGCVQWCSDLDSALRGLHRSLKPGGLMAMTLYAAGTFGEVAQAWRAIGEPPEHRMMRLPSAESFRTALVRAGFSLETFERRTYEQHYASASEALKALKSTGVTNANSDRAKGLLGKSRFAQFLRALSAGQIEEGFSLSYVAIFAIAYKPMNN